MGAKRTASSQQSAQGRQGKPAGEAPQRTVYKLTVRLIGGYVLPDFAERNPTISRTLEIAGDQTLEDLHRAIFRAFDREEEHLWEFQIGGRRPFDRNATSYEPPDPFGEGEPEASARTRIDALGLQRGDVFFYWFDFGDDWWHRIGVTAVRSAAVPKGELPRVVKRVGESPPQYPFEYDDDEDVPEEELAQRA